MWVLDRPQLMAQAQSLANWRAHKKLTLYVVRKVNNHLVFALSDKFDADDADERGHSQHCSGGSMGVALQRFKWE